MRVAHFGTFDVENYGDLLFPLVVRRRLAAVASEFVFVSPVGGDPVWADCMPTVTADALTEIELDGLIVGGGNIIHADNAGVAAYRRDALAARLAYGDLWMEPARLSRDRGIPLCWNAPGVPQAFAPRKAPVVSWAASSANHLTVRDHQSRVRLRESGVHNAVEVVPDSAFDVAALFAEHQLDEAYRAAFARADRTVPQRTISIHLTKRYLREPDPIIAQRLDRIAKANDAVLVLVALGRCHGDDLVATSIAMLMDSEPLLIAQPQSLLETAAFIARSERYIGSSLHGLITALAFGKPATSVARGRGAQKHLGTLQQFGLESLLVDSWGEAERRQALPGADVRGVLPAARAALDRHWDAVGKELQSGRSAAQAEDEPSMGLFVETALLAAAGAPQTRAPIPDREVTSAFEIQRRQLSIAEEAIEHLAELLRDERARAEERPSDEHLAQLERDLAALRAQADEEIAKREARADAELAAHLARLEQARGEIDEHRREVEVARAQLGRLAEQLHAANVDAVERAAETHRTLRRARQFEARLASAERELARRHRQESPERALVEGLVQARLLHEIQRRELVQARAAAVHRAEGAEAAVQDVAERAANDLDRARTEHAATCKALAAAEVRLAELHTQLEHSVAALVAVRDDLDHRLAELTGVRNDLAHRVAVAERLKGEMVGIRELAERISTSRAWTWGHRIMRILRRMTLRAAVGEGAMPRLLERIASAEQALMLPARTPSPSPSPAPIVLAPGSTALAPVVLAPESTALAPGVPDDAAHPKPPSDVARILRTTAAVSPSSVDVIVCVHGALEDVNRCFTALLERSGLPLRLIVIDDGSDAVTRAYLREFAVANPGVELHHNDGDRHGYTIAANLGLRASTAEYSILLNSDTIVTRGWLQGIVDIGLSDNDIGIIGPLSNAASHQSVPLTKMDGDWAVNPLPGWANEDTLALVIASLPGEAVLDVPFVNGFCFVIRRRVIETVGFFDEQTFASGYSEENDYSRRTAAAGFRLVVATGSYVFHAKSRSFGHADRKRLAKRNYKRFLKKHGENTIRALVGELEENVLLRALRARVSEALADPRTAAELLPRLRVTFVLPGISRGGSGGSHSIYQEVSAMRRLGLPARVVVARASWPRVEETYPDAGDLFVPYDSIKHLSALTAGDDVLVATHHTSVPAVAEIVTVRPATLGAYYVQDYEPLFWPPTSPKTLEAKRSYAAIPGGLVFAKTRWLQRTVAEGTAVPVAKVEPSLDLEIFHGRGRQVAQTLHVVAMIRPRTPRRAPRETLEVLARLRAHLGTRLRISTFGCDESEITELTPDIHSDHLGILNRPKMAELLRTADVFVDCSTYQAFGRTGLEAMACGAVPVLPLVGGACEFAIDGENAVLVDTLNTDAVVQSTLRLLGDTQRLTTLSQRGIGDARRFTPERAALSEYTLFCRAVADRNASSAAR